MIKNIQTGTVLTKLDYAGNTDFYLVIKRTPKTVRIQQLETIAARADHYGQNGIERPLLKFHQYSKPLTKRIANLGYCWSVWDGKATEYETGYQRSASCWSFLLTKPWNC